MFNFKFGLVFEDGPNGLLRCLLSHQSLREFRLDCIEEPGHDSATPRTAYVKHFILLRSSYHKLKLCSEDNHGTESS